MNPKIAKYSIIGFAYLAVLWPLWTRIGALSWSANADQLLLNLFPLFGLSAFTLLWLHSLSGVFEPWLRRYINFERFVHITATIIFWCLIAHPLLLFAGLDFNVSGMFVYYDAKYIWLAIIAWLLLITYDIGKALKKYHFFTTHWNTMLIVSNIGFLLTFFHSLALGSDLQSGPLRAIWIFYSVTAIFSIIYTYGLKRFLK